MVSGNLEIALHYWDLEYNMTKLVTDIVAIHWCEELYIIAQIELAFCSGLVVLSGCLERKLNTGKQASLYLFPLLRPFSYFPRS